jgi:hypothetical protein
MEAPTPDRPLHLAYPAVLHGLTEDDPARTVMHTLSWSSGSILVDAVIGGVAGYILAPSRSNRLYWAAGGGVATGAAGVCGLFATCVASYVGRSPERP